MSSECCVIISDIEKYLEHDRMSSDTNSDKYEDMQQIRARIMEYDVTKDYKCDIYFIYYNIDLTYGA